MSGPWRSGGACWARSILHRYEEAVRLQEQAYELRKKVLGETHPETQASKKNLAVMYRKLGRQEDADRLG